MVPLIVAGLVGACTKVEPPPQPEPVTPAPVTPIKAEGATQRAIQLYPALAVKDSLFNRTFREVYNQELEARPYTLTAVDWPLNIARRTAGLLGVTPMPEYTPRPTPEVVYVQPPTPRPGTMLDRPVQKEHFRMHGTPEIRPVYTQ